VGGGRAQAPTALESTRSEIGPNGWQSASAFEASGAPSPILENLGEVAPARRGGGNTLSAGWESSHPSATPSSPARLSSILYLGLKTLKLQIPAVFLMFYAPSLVGRPFAPVLADAGLYSPPVKGLIQYTAPSYTVAMLLRCVSSLLCSLLLLYHLIRGLCVALYVFPPSSLSIPDGVPFSLPN
jgi:hypothetical protein